MRKIWVSLSSEVILLIPKAWNSTGDENNKFKGRFKLLQSEITILTPKLFKDQRLRLVSAGVGWLRFLYMPSLEMNNNQGRPLSANMD